MVQDVLLVGFGAVGAIYAMVLQRGKLARVTVVARSNYDLVREHGCTFNSWKYGEITGWRPDRLVKSVEEAADRQYAYVFVVTKAVPELMPTPRLLSPLLKAPYTEKYEQPVYVLLQNGLGIEKDLYEAAKLIGKAEPKIVSTAIRIGANLTAPNCIVHEYYDKIVAGVYRHKDTTTNVNSLEEAALLGDLKNLLEAGGSEIEIVPEFRGRNSYSLPAIFRHPSTDPGVTYSPYVSPTTSRLVEEYTIPTIKALLGEVISLGHALGIPETEGDLPLDTVDTVMDYTMKLYTAPTSTHKPSMMLDMENDGPMEVEVIVGNVVRMGRERGIDLPRVEMIYALLLVMQNQIFRKREAGAGLVAEK